MQRLLPHPPSGRRLGFGIDFRSAFDSESDAAVSDNEETAIEQSTASYLSFSSSLIEDGSKTGSPERGLTWMPASKSCCIRSQLRRPGPGREECVVPVSDGMF